MNMKYDVAIVLGTGIRKDGTLPESCVVNVKKAVELYRQKQVAKLVFSGKWAWNCIYIPPFTEAHAMKLIAKSHGVPENDILVEDDSVTVASGLCNVKEKYLIPNSYKSIAVICISDVLKERFELNLYMILGPEYAYEIIMSPSVYTPEKYQELKDIETKKMVEARKFFENIVPGDHSTIYLLGMDDINKKLKQNEH
jgi:hypothetical protein